MLLLMLLPVAIVLGLYLYHFYVTRSRLYTSVEKMFPGPKPLPFIGSALEFPLNEGRDGICKTLTKFANEYARRFRVWLGPLCFIVIYNDKDVETLLSSSKHIDKSLIYDYIKPWLGLGLLTSTGAKWKSRRRIITPTFHFKILEQFTDVFEANGQILLEILRERADGKTSFDIYPYCNLYALDNVCESAMGVSINAQKESESTYVKAIKDECSVITTRVFQPWLSPEPIFQVSKYGTIQKNALAIIHKHTNDTIKQRREEMRQKKANNEQIQEEIDGLNQKKKMVFLDLLLESAEGSLLSDEGIREEVDTFMFEGHDTVTSGIAFTLYALSQNPQIQDLVYEEQKSLFGDSKRAATYNEYQEMKFLERVIKESQRLFPSVPVIARHITEDLVLNDGSFLPKGCQAAILLPALHRDPKVWQNPDKFDPDNFLPENTANKNPYAYVPFSAGARNCIGQRYAMLELKASVSKVVRNFKLLPCPPESQPKLVTELVLVSANGINLRLQERT